MAKKGGLQQLQAELNNDEDFDRFVERFADVLIIIDVYSEWCGPCLGVVNALRKIKLEIGGDKLQLAVAKSDYITKLRRFRKRSEPTWLFIRNQKSINLVFGSNVPKLMRIIEAEIKLVDSPMTQRSVVEIDELHPEEEKREAIKRSIQEAIESKEHHERETKRIDYLMYCTNAILENFPDIGVSIFGTHIPREMYKKVSEPAEAMKIQCKDRRYQTVTKEDFITINTFCSNPLPEDVIEQMLENNVLICFWKVSDEVGGSLTHAMHQYVHEVTKKIVEPPDEVNPEERVTPPIIEPIKIKVEYEVDDHVICPVYEEDGPKERRSSLKAAVTEDELFAEEEMGEEEEASVQDNQPGMPVMDMPGIDIALDDDNKSDDDADEEENIIDEPPPKKVCTKIVDMPAVWVPNDDRTHAALVYVFFRPQTFPFLPPDPPPEPPHVVMAFETYKKRDLISLAERNKADIPMFGFFTSDDADEAKFIANSAQKYVQQSPNDKLVLKVNKVTSHTMLTLVSYGATYVSPNPIVGKEEAIKFFPETYKTAEQEREEALEAQKAAGGGRKSKAPQALQEELQPEVPPEMPQEGETEAIEDAEEDAGEPVGEGDFDEQEGVDDVPAEEPTEAPAEEPAPAPAE